MKSFILAINFLLLNLFGFSQNNWLKGTWEGEGYQYNTKSKWTIKLTVTENYIIEYPSLVCSGEWKIIKSKKNIIEFKENITNNLESCINDCRVIVKRTGKNELKVKYYNPNSRKRGAIGIIKRLLN